MADLDKDTFVGTYASVSTGVFKDNTTNDIIPEDMRDFTTDLGDSFTQTKYNTPSIGGSTYTLNFGSRQRGLFILATRSAATVVALAADTNAKECEFVLTIGDVAATYEFPAAFQMSDVRWDSGTNIITFTETGKYLGRAIYDGANWIMEIAQAPFV